MLRTSEDRQHFKEYALAQDFNPERFQLKNSELEAAKAGRTLWTWFWATASEAKKVSRLEFGSELGTEDFARDANTVRWSEEEQDVRLSNRP